MRTGFLLEIPKEREYLEDPRRKWEINIRIYFIGWQGVYWINLAHVRDQLWTVVMKLFLP
jgi:hypothetical protein